MATLLLRPLMRPQSLGLGLGLSLTAFHSVQQRPTRLDSYASTQTRQASRLPQRQLNPKSVRQITSGSIVGLCAGLAVSTFSKSLALLLGLLVVGVQVAARYGINLIPYNRLQKYVKSVNLQDLVQENVAFKLSFGTTFALAAFMHF